MSPPVVDVDDESTWPPAVSAWVTSWADKLRGSTQWTCDLKVPLEGEDEFCSLFAGYWLRAYHATRLLTHERDMIHRDGMRMSSAQLIADRIAAARAAGAITDAEQAAMLSNHAYSPKADKFAATNRKDRVCLIFSRTLLDRDAHGVEDLLNYWGGEIVYSYPHPTQQRLRSLGRPSIVVALLDVSKSPGRDLIMPSLGKLFVAARLGLDDVGAEIHHKAPIPPDQVEAIWNPDDADYQRHADLPRDV